MAIPKPDPKDWLTAAADELRLGDRETLKLLQNAYRNVNQILKGLPDAPDAPFGNLIYRAQLERVKRRLLDQQADLFTKVGDLAAARRLRSASRAAKLSRAADNALLLLVGEGEQGRRLYEGAQITAQRTVETMLARAGISKVPLAERIYRTSVWMNDRLDRLITQTMAAGLNARRFAKVARDWFAPSVPGGTRYAAMRLARTEINNAFHATSISYARDKPWVNEMEWHLSKSHPKKDRCDLFAAESPFSVVAVPPKPHPQCLCYVTEVTPSEDEWIDRFVAGEFDDYLDAELAKLDSPTEQVGATGQPVKVDKLKQEPQRSLPNSQTESLATQAVPEQYLQALQSDTAFKASHGGTAKVRSDTVMEAIAKDQGLSGLPTIVAPADLEAAIASGMPELMRAMRERSHSDNFRNGSYYAGVGNQGNGIYAHYRAAGFSAEKQARIDFLGAEDAELTDAQLLATGRYDDDDIKALHRSVRRNAPKITNRLLEETKTYGEFVNRMTLKPGTKILDLEKDLFPMQREYLQQLESLPKTAELELWITAMQDPGRFAAYRGVKAYYGTTPGEIVVVDRSALLIQEELL